MDQLSVASPRLSYRLLEYNFGTVNLSLTPIAKACRKAILKSLLRRCVATVASRVVF